MRQSKVNGQALHRLPRGSLSLVLALMLLTLSIVVIPQPVSATEAYLTQDGWRWYYDTSTPYELKRVERTGGSLSVAIPDKLDGSTPLTSIGIACFSSGDGKLITSITGMPSSLLEIREQAFYQCSALTSVVIGDHVVWIRSSSFGQTSLVTVNIPNSVEELGNTVFAGTTTLTSVQFGVGLNRLGNNVFDGCSALTLITFYGAPPSIVGTNLFVGCSASLVGKVPDYMGWPAPGEYWHGLKIGYFGPPVPTNLRAGMNGNVIRVTCDPIGGLVDSIAYERSVDNVTWSFRGSHLFDWNDSIGDILYQTFYYRCYSQNNWGHSNYSEVVMVRVLTDEFMLQMYDRYDWPVFDDICGEPSLWYEDAEDTLHCWFASGPELGESTPHYLSLWYTHATGGNYSDWAAPVRCTGLVNMSRFPFVLEYRGKWYCFNSPYYDGDVYLWESADKIDWTCLNGGQPVIRKSNSTISIYHHIWNVGVCVVGSTWHMWVECGSAEDQSDTISAYTYGTLERLDWQSHLRSTPAGIMQSRNVCPVYVPERNAIMIFSAKPDPKYYEGQPYPITYIGVYTVSLRDNLYDPASYHLSPYFRIGNGEDVSDPHYAATNGEHGIMGVIQYFSNDAARPHIYQVGTWMDRAALYDYLVHGPDVQTVERTISTTISLEDTGVIWLLIYFIVVLVLAFTLGSYGAMAGCVIGAFVLLMSEIRMAPLLFIAALVTAMVILFRRRSEEVG